MREPIKDGEVRESKNGLALVVGIWQDDDGHTIHIVSEGNFISTINDKEGSARQHRNLHKHLKETLQEHGKWRD
ncbi:hypothetical protein BC351_00855 [Paenibacillus ferrarius]|uniref:Uncharacterized protein n=1 Tax=Paenibacillus ferrarius TaxID=1469647 RepID=A0A1V4HSL9_9BACL|nr:hypothetical protein [Paenibacillus ferrarius]OPH61822.1 hypothetical protein BC351_00855 [Paenibacillus ferrarius]